MTTYQTDADHMGNWITLHLFDDKNFYSRVVPALRGEKGSFELAYVHFMKSHIVGEIDHLPKERREALLTESVLRVKEIAGEFDDSFKIHRRYNSIKDYSKQRKFLQEYAGYFEFNLFFEYYLFGTCADFFPHLPLGKRGLYAQLDTEPHSLAASFMNGFEDWRSLFCADGMGIVNWATHDEVALLYYDRENLKSTNKAFLESFQNFLGVAYQHELGLIMGVDMREELLEQLPGFKLVQKEAWDSIGAKGLLFER